MTHYEIRQYESHEKPIPLIIHVPHASDFIPPELMDQFVLTPEALAEQHRRMVDHHVDKLFEMALRMGATLFVNKLSRLVFDPERFEDDDQEPMAKHGMGAVYTHTDDGERLRGISFSQDDRQALIDTYYRPYHEALNDLVDEFIERFGCCYILDAHSYPAEPNGFENPESARPNYCIGHDDYHVPEAWLQWWREWGAAQIMPKGRNIKVHVTHVGPDSEESHVIEDAGPRELKVRFNTPFSGSLVSNRHYLSDNRVKSMMIEVKRSIYMDEQTGELKDRPLAWMYDPIHQFLDYACSDLSDTFHPQEAGISRAAARRRIHGWLVGQHKPGDWLGYNCITGVVSGEKAGLTGVARWDVEDPSACWAIMRATLPGFITSGQVVMVEKESGKMVYVGSTYDEG